MVEQGHRAESLGQIREGLSAWLAQHLALLAQARGKDGQVEDWLSTVVEALAFVERTEERYYEAELYRLKGELLLQLSPDKQSEAEACFHQGLNVARKQ